MLPWILAGLLTVGTFAVDFINASRMEDSVSQMDHYISMLQGQMTVEEFFSVAWPSLAFILMIFVACFIIATPKRRRV